MKFYFVRHGETDANRHRLMSGGGIDIPINSTGETQAKALAETIHLYQFEQIFVSSCLRAQQTAEIICGQLPVKPQVLDELREWHMGEWEGQPYEHVLPQFLGEGEPKGGETRAQFKSRVERGLTMCLAHRQTFLMVAHGGVWLIVQDLLKLPRSRVANCVLIEVRYENAQWHQRHFDP